MDKRIEKIYLGSVERPGVDISFNYITPSQEIDMNKSK